MVSKSILTARTVTALCAAALLLGSCASLQPWADEPVADEVNLSFVVDHNLLYLPSVTINDRPGRIFFSTASPRTVVDPRFIAEFQDPPAPFVVRFGEKAALRFNPVALSLGAAGDAMLGADLWGRHAISVNYVAGLLTYQKEGIHPGLMTLFRFDAQPTVDLDVDGKSMRAIVDTACPDTLEIPGETTGRREAHVTIAGSDLGTVDIAVVPSLTRARLGNRLLSKFLVSIDYGRHVVGLWRDPRVR